MSAQKSCINQKQRTLHPASMLLAKDTGRGLIGRPPWLPVVRLLKEPPADVFSAPPSIRALWQRRATAFHFSQNRNECGPSFASEELHLAMTQESARRFIRRRLMRKWRLAGQGCLLLPLLLRLGLLLRRWGHVGRLLRQLLLRRRYASLLLRRLLLWLLLMALRLLLWLLVWLL